jgi:hypothetical protein
MKKELIMMRLLSDLLPGKIGNLYSGLNYTLNVRFLLTHAVIISGIISICVTILNGAEVKSNDSSVEQVTAYRNPFSLPSGVRFEERKEMVGAYSEDAVWKEGVVASSVNGFFKSGNIVRANINGIWVREGDWVGEEQVMEIGVENVVLMGEEESARRTLPLRGDGARFEVIERVR